MTTKRLTEARLERNYLEFKIDRVDMLDDGSFDVREDSTCIFIKNELGARSPRVGDTIRTFGKGRGYIIRGIGLVEKGELVALYRYKTEDEEDKSQKLENLKSDKRKRKEWEDHKENRAATIAALPEPLRKRIEFFMRRTDWGWNFGPYEIFCCVEAAKIAETIASPIDISEFAKLSSSAQEKLIPHLDYENHSGNTFGAAVYLARALVERPESVFKDHGALCPWVGCREYGCFAVEANQQ